LMLACLALIACNPDSTDSTNVTTAGIYANMEVNASSPGRSGINVELNVGGPNGTNLDLTSTERLEASAGGQTIILSQDTDFLDIDYEGTLNTSSSASPFRISFFREDGTIIDGSTVSLPDEFTLTSPSENEVFNANQSLPLRWTPGRSGQSIELQTYTRCTTNSGSEPLTLEIFDLSDDGAEDWPLSNITADNGNDIDPTIDCEMDVKLVRNQNGTLDARFEEGGQITATQSREVENLTLRLQ